MPHNLRGWIEADVGRGFITADDAEMALEWCIGAATTTDGRSSVLAFEPNPVTAGGGLILKHGACPACARQGYCKPSGQHK